MKKYGYLILILLMFLSINKSYGATVKICGEEYKLNIPILSTKTVSFEDKYGDKVFIYTLPYDIVRLLDNRTYENYRDDTVYVFVKNNKSYAYVTRYATHSLLFLDNNYDTCVINFQLDKKSRRYNNADIIDGSNFENSILNLAKVKPLSADSGINYSNITGIYLIHGTYIGDNDSLGVFKPNFEYNNSSIDSELLELLYAASEQDTGMAIYSTNSESDYNESSEYDAEEEYYSEDEYNIYYDNYAVSSYFIEALQNTLEQGINSLVIDESSDKMSYIFSHTTPLMLAVYAGYNDIADYLLEHGANPAYYNNGADALCFAVLTNNKHMIYKLVESGAPVILEKDYSSYAIPLALYEAPTNMTVPLKELIDSVLEEKEKDFLYKNAQ